MQCRCWSGKVQVCVQCRCWSGAVQVLKWCNAMQMGYMGHMWLCVISVKKLVNEGIILYKRIGKWIVWDIWEMNKLPKCSSFQLYLQFFDKYYLALQCLFGLSKCSSFPLYLQFFDKYYLVLHCLFGLSVSRFLSSWNIDQYLQFFDKY